MRQLKFSPYRSVILVWERPTSDPSRGQIRHPLEILLNISRVAVIRSVCCENEPFPYQVVASKKYLGQSKVTLKKYFRVRFPNFDFFSIFSTFFRNHFRQPARTQHFHDFSVPKEADLEDFKSSNDTCSHFWHLVRPKSTIFHVRKNGKRQKFYTLFWKFLKPKK